MFAALICRLTKHVPGPMHTASTATGRRTYWICQRCAHEQTVARIRESDLGSWLPSRPSSDEPRRAS